MTNSTTEKTYVMKFGSFFLVHEGLEYSELDDDAEKDLCAKTRDLLVQGAKSSPLVTRIIDDGMPDPCWGFEITDDRTGTAFGLLGHVVFEVSWPTRNWSSIDDEELPERLIIATNGVMYAVVAPMVGDPPFEDAFEMGRQAQDCLKAIYGELQGCFTYKMGPTPMWPTVYFQITSDIKERAVTPIKDQEVLVALTPAEGEDLEEFIVQTVGMDADWAVVEHYGAMLKRGEFIGKDIEITMYLDECFRLQKELWKQRGIGPQHFWSRHKVRQSLRAALAGLYEAHASAAELVNMLRRDVRDSKNSFSKAYFFAHCPDYTAEHVSDSLDWDDSHVLQAARFLEDDLRSSSLEQVTMTAALIGGIAGGAAGAILSRI